MTAPSTGRPSIPTSTSLRPALGLLAGLGVTVLIVFLGVTITTLAALRGVDAKSYVAPFWTYPTNLLISVLGAVAGGIATARITAGRSLFTVLVLALILLMSALTPVLRGAAAAPGQPRWYPLALAILPPLAVLLGGVRERRKERETGITHAE
jgi:hypothetical protein